MNLYKYRVEDINGIVVRGSLHASSKSNAVSLLPAHRKLITLEDKGTIIELPPAIRKYLKPKKLSRKELSGLFNQLSFMLGAGMTMASAISILATTGTDYVRTFCTNILEVVNQGKSLADGIAKYNYLLPSDYSFVLEAGQRAGTLDTTLAQLAARLDSEVATGSKVKSAMIYPVIVLVLVLAVAIFLFTTIIPQFSSILQELGGKELPAMTQMMLSISEFITSYWLLFIVISLVTVSTVRFICKKFFMTQISAITLKIPILGKIIRTSEMIVLYTNLSFMIESGATNEESFRLSMNAVSNLFVKKQLTMAYAEILKGKSFTQALSMTAVAQTLELQIIEVGISTGHLSALLDNLVLHMNRDLDALIKTLMIAMEPLMMVVLGGIVGVIMVSIYGPLFSMSAGI